MTNTQKLGALLALVVGVIALQDNIRDLYAWVFKAERAHEVAERMEEEVPPLLQELIDSQQLDRERLDAFQKRFEAEDAEELDQERRLLRECMQEDPKIQDRVRRAYCAELEEKLLNGGVEP